MPATRIRVPWPGIRLLGLTLLVMVLAVVAVTDVDGDPTTSNTCFTMLAADAGVGERRDVAAPRHSERPASRAVTAFGALVNWAGRWLSTARSSWHPDSAPIRGP